MTDKLRLDLVYLNKHKNESLASNWSYYRITSIGGRIGDSIEVCLLNWPTLEDINIVGNEKLASVWNPFETGSLSAHPNLCSLLWDKWNIDHKQSSHIGVRPTMQA